MTAVASVGVILRLERLYECDCALLCGRWTILSEAGRDEVPCAPSGAGLDGAVRRRLVGGDGMHVIDCVVS